MVIGRRQFLTGLGAGLSGLSLAGTPTPRWKQAMRRKRAVETYGTARNLIFVLLEGGISHVDTFDFKSHFSQSGAGLGPVDMGGWIWPQGIMPKLERRGNQFSLVRAMSAVEAVHERGVYHLLTAHRQSGASSGSTPDFASVLSYKMQDQRRPEDTLPTVMKVTGISPGAGFLGVNHRGLQINEVGGVDNLDHGFYDVDGRMGLLDQMLEGLDGQFGDARSDRVRDLEQARTMMKDGELQALLGISEDEEDEIDYDDASALFLRQCETAVNVINADKGTRVFQMYLGGWDHHDNIYDPYNLPRLARALDEGLAYLLDQLAALPGKAGGASLLDETLVVAAGEFGRTTGRLNTSAGRDHYPYVNPIWTAGGGVKGGRVIGATSNDGSYITDQGWSRDRYMTMGDLNASIYSALGIDWNDTLIDTTSGRLFELVETTQTGPVHAIDPLFV